MPVCKSILIVEATEQRVRSKDINAGVQIINSSLPLILGQPRVVCKEGGDKEEEEF